MIRWPVSGHQSQKVNLQGRSFPGKSGEALLGRSGSPIEAMKMTECAYYQKRMDTVWTAATGITEGKGMSRFKIVRMKGSWACAFWANGRIRNG